MNKLNKLIEQYERENKDLNCKTRFDDIFKLLEDEEEGLGQFIVELFTLALSRPTCTANERLFLDDIREKGSMDSDDYLIFDSFRPYDAEGTQLDQSDFEANLKELVNDTKTKAD